MSSQRGNAKRTRPQKYQNKSAFKNVYHDTSKQTQKIVNTDVSGVCMKCKDCIDWKIKYKKYKPLTQPKTCVSCKEKTVKQAYHVYCHPCCTKLNKCAKCGEKKEIVIKPKLSEAEQASQDRELQFELEHLPERKRRTFLRLQEKGLLPSGDFNDDEDEQLDDDNDDDDDINNDDDIDDVKDDDNDVDENDVDDEDKKLDAVDTDEDNKLSDKCKQLDIEDSSDKSTSTSNLTENCS